MSNPAERHVEREFAMQMLFQMEAQKDFSQECYDKFLSNFLKEGSGSEYVKTLYTAFTEHKEEVDKAISDNAKGWTFQRIGKADLAILRIAVTEILFSGKDSGVNEKIAINEAVNFAKKYCADESSKFVNGLLSGVVRSCAETGLE